MWNCPLCGQAFMHHNQVHSCGDKVLQDFLAGKSVHTLSLFSHLLQRFREAGKISVHPTKSMIAIAADTRIAYITRLGKDFVDIVFPFDQPFADNLCFHKIAQVPGNSQFNHHFRMCHNDDINEEVFGFIRMAYQKGVRK